MCLDLDFFYLQNFNNKITIVINDILQPLMMKESLPDTPANKSLNKRTIGVHTKGLIQTCDVSTKN